MKSVAIMQWCFQKVEKFSVMFSRLVATAPPSAHTIQDSQKSKDNFRETEMRHFLVVGLGNDGYEGTRHSVGMRAVDRLTSKLGLVWTQSGGYVCSTTLESGEDVFKLTLFKPKTFMNINGVSVAKTAKKLSIPPSDVFLVHDELDKNVGKFHLKEGGSAGGHNGVLSCISCLGSKEMPRLRIGISRPLCRSDIVNYVLSKFTREELVVVDETIELAVDFLLNHITKIVADSRVDKLSPREIQDCKTASSGGFSTRKKAASGVANMSLGASDHSAEESELPLVKQAPCTDIEELGKNGAALKFTKYRSVVEPCGNDSGNKEVER